MCQILNLLSFSLKFYFNNKFIKFNSKFNIKIHFKKYIYNSTQNKFSRKRNKNQKTIVTSKKTCFIILARTLGFKNFKTKDLSINLHKFLINLVSPPFFRGSQTSQINT